MFVDKAKVYVKAGDGGDGVVSFRHEIYVDKGGPDGGDGGRGGDVVFVADENANTLVNFRFKHELKAANGVSGNKRQMRGRSGEDFVVPIPVGTQVWHDGEIIADLVANGQRAVVARGGDGGFGNAHFKSSTRQTPRVAELGEKGEEFELELELKLLADVGLVGFPNAGKSSFLTAVSNARPEVADYPFTTLTPHLGVADIDSTSLLIADIPGLIEGASRGKGLGDEFLRHIERTAVLLHLIDIYDDDVAASYNTIRGELDSYGHDLADRPSVVALTKVEGLPDDGVQAKLTQLQKVVPKDTPLLTISSHAQLGLREALRDLSKMVAATRAAQKMAAPESEDEGVPIIGLTVEQKRDAWRVTQADGRFTVAGHKIEKFAARTNFESEPGRRRLWDIMRKMGIMHELERKKIQVGDVVVIGRTGEWRMTYGV